MNQKLIKAYLLLTVCSVIFADDALYDGINPDFDKINSLPELSWTKKFAETDLYTKELAPDLTAEELGFGPEDTLLGWNPHLNVESSMANQLGYEKNLRYLTILKAFFIGSVYELPNQEEDIWKADLLFNHPYRAPNIDKPLNNSFRNMCIYKNQNNEIIAISNYSICPPAALMCIKQNLSEELVNALTKEHNGMIKDIEDAWTSVHYKLPFYFQEQVENLTAEDLGENKFVTDHLNLLAEKNNNLHKKFDLDELFTKTDLLIKEKAHDHAAVSQCDAVEMINFNANAFNENLSPEKINLILAIDRIKGLHLPTKYSLNDDSLLMKLLLKIDPLTEKMKKETNEPGKIPNNFAWRYYLKNSKGNPLCLMSVSLCPPAISAAFTVYMPEEERNAIYKELVAHYMAIMEIHDKFFDEIYLKSNT